MRSSLGGVYPRIQLAIVLCVIGMFSRPVFAENAGVENMDVSVVGGITLNDPSGATNGQPVNYLNGTGFSLGVLGNIPLPANFSAEAGLLFTQHNFTNAGLYGGYSYTNTFITMNAIEIPVVLRYWVVPWLSFGVGPYGAFGVGNVNINQNGYVQSYNYAQAGYNTFDFGFVGSAQLKYRVNDTVQILIDARYNFGVTDLYNSPITTIYTRTFQALGGVGLSF